MGRGSLANKQERRDRLLGLLKSDASWTTHNLCLQLEVSHRTLMRDLEELREAGIPVESERGRGGGVRLAKRWGVDRLQLSHREVISLLTSLAISESLSASFITENTKSIRQKIAMSFPDSQRKIINRLRDRILVGAPATGAILENFKTPKKSCQETIGEAFFEFKKVELNYTAESGATTDRIVEPHYLLLCWPIWYILAWDQLRQAIRIFRMDRVNKAQVIPELMKRRSKSEFMDAHIEYFNRL